MNDFIDNAADFSAWLDNDPRMMMEDHNIDVSKELLGAIDSFEKFRARIKNVVEENYPEKMEAFVKTFSAFDKAFANVDKFARGL